MTLTTPRNAVPAVPSSGAKPPVAPSCGTALNTALDFSKLQEAMVDGQPLSVSARAKLLESPWAKPEQAPNSVQKLAQQFAGVGIAPPQTQAKKALQFGTPGKGVTESNAPRVALGEIDQNAAPAVDAPNESSSSHDGVAENADKDARSMLTQSVSDPAEIVHDLQQDVKVDDNRSPQVASAANVDQAATEQDCAEIVSDIADVFQRMEDCELDSAEFPALLGHNVVFDSEETFKPVVEDALSVADDACKGSLKSSVHSMEQPAPPILSNLWARDDIGRLVIEDGAQRLNTREPMAPADHFKDVSPVQDEDAKVYGMQQATREEIAEEIQSAHDCDESVLTIPDGEEAEDAIYETAVDDDETAEIQEVDIMMPDDAVAEVSQAEEEPQVEMGADARSQAITVTETSLQQQAEVVQEVTADEVFKAETSGGVDLGTESDDFDASPILPEDQETGARIPQREISPVPDFFADPLAQASANDRQSLDVAPPRRNSSPMEDHLKQVVKSTVVGYCSEVEEQNALLYQKVDVLEKQLAQTEKLLAKNEKQLAKTSEQLEECATKVQMDQLLEALAARDARQSSCQGCTIC